MFTQEMETRPMLLAILVKLLHKLTDQGTAEIKCGTSIYIPSSPPVKDWD